MKWKQSSSPVLPEIRAFVTTLDSHRDVAILKKSLGEDAFADAHYLTLHACTWLLQISVALGLTLCEIGVLMGGGKVDDCEDYELAEEDAPDSGFLTAIVQAFIETFRFTISQFSSSSIEEKTTTSSPSSTTITSNEVAALVSDDMIAAAMQVEDSPLLRNLHAEIHKLVMKTLELKVCI